MKLFKYFIYLYFLTKDSDQTFDDQAVAATGFLSIILTLNIITLIGLVEYFYAYIDFNIIYLLGLIILINIILFLSFLTDKKVKTLIIESKYYKEKIWKLRISVWSYVAITLILLLYYLVLNN